MTALKLYPQSKYPNSLTERCRAEVDTRGVGPTRCSMRVREGLGGLCWRHR